MIIDFHTHIFPDDIARRAVEGLKARARIPAFSDGTREGLLRGMRRAGVDLSVVLPVVTAPRQFRSITEFAHQINLQGEGLLSFGGIHPASEHWQEELRELRDRGFRGIKLHPDYQDVFADDPRCVRLARQAAAYGMIVVLHSGLDLGLPSPVHCTPERAARLLDALEGYDRVVLAHCGASHMSGEVLKHLAGRPVYFDLSFDLVREPRETLLRVLEAHGPDRCLFASDSPWTDQKESLEALAGLGLTPGEQEAVSGGNALRLLGPLPTGGAETQLL